MNHIIKLNDAYKRYTLDQEKLYPPEETIIRLKEKLKLLDLDILSYTKRIDNGRLDIPVYFSVCGRDASALIGTKKQMGKGATPAQSKASAIMELVERFSFFSFRENKDNFLKKKYINIRENKVPFEIIAASVNDDSAELEITKKIFEQLPLKWTKAFNLTKQKEVLIPFDWFFSINEFNGTAAGNCVEETLLQGICEIVERHTSSIISRNQIKVPGIRVSSAKDKMVIEMLQKYKNAGINLYISDFTLDMGIPTIGVFAYDPSTFPKKSELVWTAGTTTSPEKALSRALTEVAQLSGDFNTGSNYVASGLPKFSRMEDANFILYPDIMTNITDLPDLSDNNLKTEVENSISALANKNFEVIAINTTHPLIEAPVFYTIIAGAYFRERAIGTSVGMFSAKHIAENMPPKKAISKLIEVNTFLPDKYYIQFYIGLSYLSIGMLESAYQYFKKASKLNPTKQDMTSIYSYMGACLKDMSKYTEALDILKKGRNLDDKRTDIYNLMGFCYFMKKEHSKAIECFKQVISINPSSAIDYANIASNYRELGDKKEAVRYYKMALEIDPSIDFAAENLLKLK
mmetsp:Transcript_3131/g.1841  ORF Transcript_3131/g.1841 Transcript_3131/m.1841 type:complete len:575 (+) Transcript_3131:7107-8831(+)